MGFEIFLILAGAGIIAIWFFLPPHPDLKEDSKEPSYVYTFMYKVRALLAGITFLGLGLAGFLQNNLGLKGDWFLLFAPAVGLVFALIGVLIFASSKFNQKVWKFFRVSSTPEKDRKKLGTAFLILGLITLLIWVALLWPN